MMMVMMLRLVVRVMMMARSAAVKDGSLPAAAIGSLARTRTRSNSRRTLPRIRKLIARIGIVADAARLDG